MLLVEGAIVAVFREAGALLPLRDNLLNEIEKMAASNDLVRKASVCSPRLVKNLPISLEESGFVQSISPAIPMALPAPPR